MLSPVVNGLLKSFIQYPRPFWVAADLQLGEAESFSTPSGHAQNSAAIFGHLAYFLWTRRGRALGVLLLGLLIVLVSLSRVYLGVHFAGDVLWGVATGLALAAAYAWGKPRVVPWLETRSLALHLFLALVAGAGIFAVQALLLAIASGMGASFPMLYQEALAAALEDAATVAGLAVGLWIGLVLEQRYVRFTVAGPAWQRIVRYLAGVVGLFVIWLGLGMLFPREPEAVGLGLRVLRYALAMFWAIAGWPWLFVRLRLGQGEASPVSAQQAGASPR